MQVYHKCFLHKAGARKINSKYSYALQHAASLVYLKRKSLEISSVLIARSLASLLCAQIYDGFAGKFLTGLLSRAQLKIGDDDSEFGIVAQSIKEKGWKYTIASFKALTNKWPQARLLLIDKGVYLDGLREVHLHSRIYFLGFSSDSINRVRLFNVWLLLRYFAYKRLPNSVAEYPSCEVPMVVAQIGEMPQILEVSGQSKLMANLLERISQWFTGLEQLGIAMRNYLEQLAVQRELVWQCFDTFRMEQRVTAYEKLFERLLAPAA